MKRTASLRSFSGDSGTTGRCGFAKMSIPATRKRLDSLGVAASLSGSSSISWGGSASVGASQAHSTPGFMVRTYPLPSVSSSRPKIQVPLGTGVPTRDRALGRAKLFVLGGGGAAGTGRGINGLARGCACACACACGCGTGRDMVAKTLSCTCRFCAWGAG